MYSLYLDSVVEVWMVACLLQLSVQVQASVAAVHRAETGVDIVDIIV